MSVEMLQGEIASTKELLEQRIEGLGRELHTWQVEVLRRLDELNHAQETAREKERVFVRREPYDALVARTAHDFETIRVDSQRMWSTIAAEKIAAATALNKTMSAHNETAEARLGRIESVQAKMIGGLVLCTFFVPALTALVVYLVTHSADVSGSNP